LGATAGNHSTIYSEKFVSKEWKKLTVEERTDLIKSALQKANSRTEIAMLISAKGWKGVTKNAVIGHMNRHGFPKMKAGRRPGTLSPEAIAKAAIARAERTARLKREKRAKQKAKAEHVVRNTAAKRIAGKLNAPGVIDTAPRPISKGVTLLEIQSNQCRFPNWSHSKRPDEYLFCGEPTKSGSSYCAHHHSICNEPVRVPLKLSKEMRNGSSERRPVR